MAFLFLECKTKHEPQFCLDISESSPLGCWVTMTIRNPTLCSFLTSKWWWSQTECYFSTANPLRKSLYMLYTVTSYTWETNVSTLCTQQNAPNNKNFINSTCHSLYKRYISGDMSLWRLLFNIYPLPLYLCRLNYNPDVELIFGEIGNIQWSTVPLVLGELRNMRNVKVLMQMEEGGGEEGTWKVLRNVIYCLLPPYSAFCISYVTQLSNIFPMRLRHGIILKGQCSLDKCFRNNFHDILLQKLARISHSLVLKESRNYPKTICASN